jgi:hypothetical protein
MQRRWIVFAALVLVHALLVATAGRASPPWFAERLAPLAAASIYLPLWPLHSVGLSVFGPAESGGWSAPSLLGWVIVVAVWLAVWFGVATLLTRLFMRRGSRR